MSCQRMGSAVRRLFILSLAVLQASAAWAGPPSRPGKGASSAAVSQPMEEQAGPHPDKLRKYLQAASHLYESLEYEQALEKLSRAKAYAGDTHDKATLALYEGIILADMNRREQSLVAFRLGLSLRPESKLPLKVSPKVEQDFEKVRVEVVRERTASLKVDDPIAVPPVPVAPTARANGLAYTLMGSGAVVAGTGAFLGLSALAYNERKSGMLASEAERARASARTQLTSGTVLVGGGLAVLGTGVALLLLPRWRASTAPAGAETSLLLTPLPGGLVLGSSGRF